MNARAGLLAGTMAMALAVPAWGDPSAPALPGPTFEGDRYASLWTKSPFAIATPDAITGRGRMLGDFLLALEETRGVR